MDLDPEPAGMPGQRLHLFVDETASVGPGNFLIVVAFVDRPRLEEARSAVLDLETSSERGTRKWVRSSEKQRLKYASGLEPVLGLTHRAAWRRHTEAGDRVEQTATTVADAALLHQEAAFYVQVDGFNKPELNRVRRAFRARKLLVRRLSGGRDEAEPLLSAGGLIGRLPR